MEIDLTPAAQGRGEIWWMSYKCHWQGRYDLLLCILLLFCIIMLEVLKISRAASDSKINQEVFVFRTATLNGAWKFLLVTCTRAVLKLLQGPLLCLDSQTHLYHVLQEPAKARKTWGQMHTPAIPNLPGDQGPVHSVIPQPPGSSEVAQSNRWQLLMCWMCLPPVSGHGKQSERADLCQTLCKHGAYTIGLHPHASHGNFLPHQLG